MSEVRVNPSLSDPKLKAAWAKKHIDSLRQQLFWFCDSRTYTLIGEDDLDAQMYRLKPQEEDPPVELHLVLGDALYCLRSALDQLVFALAHLTLPYPDKTQFPVLGKSIALDKEARRKFEKQTRGVPAAAAAIIESLQPYHAGDAAAMQSHLLWRLNLLCNIDKHRRIPVRGHASSYHNCIPTEAAPFIQIDESSDEISLPLRFKGQVNLKPRGTTQVVFGDMAAGILCDIAGIENIYNFVADDVIPKFESFFP